MDPEPPTEPDGASTGAERPRRAEALARLSWIPLTVIFLLGCVLRVRGFGDFWLNPDEGIYYSMVTWDSWGEFFSEYLGNAHPPLFYVLLRFVSGLTEDFGALRLIPLVCGCAVAPALFLLARECVGRNPTGALTGLLAALMFAIAPTAIQMSQIIRPYTMQIASMTLGLYFLVRFARAGGRWSLPLYATCMVVAVLTHYGTFLVLGGAALAFFGVWACRQLTARKAGSIVLFNLPVLAVVLADYFVHIRKLAGSAVATEAVTGWLKPFMIADASRVWPSFLGVTSFLFDVPTLGGSADSAVVTDNAFDGVTAIACLLGLGYAAFRRQAWIVLLPLGVTGVAIAAAAMREYPFGCCRHSLYLGVFLALPIAYLLASGLLGDRWLAGIAALGVFAMWHRYGECPHAKILALVVGLAAFLGVVSGRLRRWMHGVIFGLAVLGMLYWNAGISRDLGSEGSAPLRERVLRRSEMERADPRIRAVRSSPGSLVMSQQTYYMLMPYYSAERQNRQWGEEGAFFHFRWGERDVFVVNAWGISLEYHTLGSHAHLYEFVTRVDREMPDIGLGRQHDVCLFSGGWGDEAGALVGFRSGRDQHGVVNELAEFEGFVAATFDLAEYKRCITEVLKKIKR